MNAIRIRKHLDSETLHLPELKMLIGHDVEITIEEASPVTAGALTPEQASREFFNPPTLEELARRQGSRGPVVTSRSFGGLADANWEGFDETLEQWRKEGASSTDGEG